MLSQVIQPIVIKTAASISPVGHNGPFAGTTLKDQGTQFLTDIKDFLQVAAPICVFISCIIGGIIYAGSTWPIIGKMKRDNPDMMNNILVGIGVILAASTIASFVAFS